MLIVKPNPIIKNQDLLNNQLKYRLKGGFFCWHNLLAYFCKEYLIIILI